jgi:alginate O-acetyltransferase complex protein AlgI
VPAIGPEGEGLLFPTVTSVLYKYYGFLAFNLATLFGGSETATALPLLQLAVLVGISFTTFRAISYTIDCYRGELKPACLVESAVYLSFFPHIAAGPLLVHRRVQALLGQSGEVLPLLAEPLRQAAVDAGG